MATDPDLGGAEDDGELEYVLTDRDEPPFDVPDVAASVWLGAPFPDGEVPEDDGNPAFEFSPTWRRRHQPIAQPHRTHLTIQPHDYRLGP